jgi:hypothetical protein
VGLWFVRLWPCAIEAPQLSCFLVDDADGHVEEAHLPASVLGFLDGDFFTVEGTADVDELAVPFDLAVGADLAYRGFGWIIRLGKPPWHRTRRSPIDAGRWVLAKRFVRPFFVVVAHKCREATSLRGLGWRRWPHGFQKRKVKTLVSAVLLRMARINPFMADAKLDPHTDSAVRPVIPVEANGEPLSERIICGKPYSRNARSSGGWHSAYCVLPVAARLIK